METEIQLSPELLRGFPPVMRWRTFAEWIGFGDSPDVVENWMRAGHVPTVRIGRHRMINLAALVKSLEEQEV